MDAIERLHALVRTVELGSLSAAARELGVTQPTVSKALAALERGVGARLVERSTTHLTPTEAGLRFVEHAQRIVEEWQEARSAARGETGRAEGLLRVNAPLGFGQMHVHGLVQRFLAAHTGLRIELILDDRYIDLVEERVDLALRLGGTLPPTAVAQGYATARRFLVAAPRYLRQSAPIRQPADLQLHPFVRFAWLASGPTIALRGPRGEDVSVTLDGRYSVNSAASILDAVLSGQGLAFAPSWMVHAELERGRLVRVLPRWEGELQPVRVVYPSRRYQPARTRLFLGFLREELPRVPGLSPPRP